MLQKCVSTLLEHLVIILPLQLQRYFKEKVHNSIIKLTFGKSRVTYGYKFKLPIMGGRYNIFLMYIILLYIKNGEGVDKIV